MIPDPAVEADRQDIQRRTLRVLTFGQVVGSAALGSAVTVGAFVVQDALGEQTPWAGLATATVTMGAAVMSQALSRQMRRVGRRPGLQRGYALAVVGGLLAAAGTETGLLAIFLPGLFLYGSGQAANLLTRYAAADLALPQERSRAIGRVVFASAFGAVLGPLMIGPAQAAGQNWLGLHRYTGPWLFTAVCFSAALVNTAVRLRPDPLVVAGGIEEADRGARPSGVAAALRVISVSRLAPVALAAMVVSQVAMVAVMAMTPVHLKLHGHESVSPLVVSLHIGGMFGFSPLIGRYCDRRGRLPAIVVGSCLLSAGAVLAALSGDVEQLLFPSLWLMGVGWSFGLIGGSSLLIDSVPRAERVGVQGSADLLMSACGGLAGFASGLIRNAIGYHLLATTSAVAAVALVVLALTTWRADTSLRARPVASG